MCSRPTSPSSDPVKQSEELAAQSKELFKHAVRDTDDDKVMVKAVVDKKKKKKRSAKKKATGFEGMLSPAVEAVISIDNQVNSGSYIDRILLRTAHDACRA